MLILLAKNYKNKIQANWNDPFHAKNIISNDNIVTTVSHYNYNY